MCVALHIPAVCQHTIPSPRNMHVEGHSTMDRKPTNAYIHYSTHTRLRAAAPIQGSRPAPIPTFYIITTIMQYASPKSRFPRNRGGNNQQGRGATFPTGSCSSLGAVGAVGGTLRNLNLYRIFPGTDE